MKPLFSRRRLLVTAPAAALALHGTSVGTLHAAAPRGPYGAAPAQPAADGAAVYFPETGHHLLTGFLAYWRANQGPQRLGAPMTEEHWDPAAEAMVQHFTLGRLEWREPSPAATASAAAGGEARTGVREVLGPPASGSVRAGVGAVPRGAGVPDWTAALAPREPVIAVPEQVRQGRAFLVELRVDDPAAPLAVSGSLSRVQVDGGTQSTPLRFFPAVGPTGAGRFFAVAGLTSGAPIGPRTVTAMARNGLELDSPPHAAGFGVVDGAFSLQRLAFAAELIPLLEPEVGELEALSIAAVTATSAPAPLWRGRFRQPVGGQLVTRHGARRDYLDPSGRTVTQSQHGGVDLAVAGGTPIASPAAGVVAFTGQWSIRGNVVVVDHGAGVHTLHAHMAGIAVAGGQPVAQGQVLGWVGSTGLSTGPHLHWEVRVGGVAVEPLEWTQRDDLGLSGIM